MTNKEVYEVAKALAGLFPGSSVELNGDHITLKPPDSKRMNHKRLRKLLQVFCRKYQVAAALNESGAITVRLET